METCLQHDSHFSVNFLHALIFCMLLCCMLIFFLKNLTNPKRFILDPNCLTPWGYSWKTIRKSWFWKKISRWQKSMQNFRACKELNTYVCYCNSMSIELAWEFAFPRFLDKTDSPITKYKRVFISPWKHMLWGAHWNCLNEAVPMSTFNIMCMLTIEKYICQRKRVICCNEFCHIS